MSNLNNVRLPNASPAYSPEQFNQLVRSLEQIVLQVNTSFAPIVAENKSTAQAWFLGK